MTTSNLSSDMTDEQADAEAKQRWGSKAFVKRAANKSLDILIKTPHPTTNILLGWGKTWTDAFTLAETRAEWHKERINHVRTDTTTNVRGSVTERSDTPKAQTEKQLAFEFDKSQPGHDV